jgi:hypothetical protein
MYLDAGAGRKRVATTHAGAATPEPNRSPASLSGMETAIALRNQARRQRQLGQWQQWSGDRAGDALVASARRLELQADALEASGLALVVPETPPDTR